MERQGSEKQGVQTESHSGLDALRPDVEGRGEASRPQDEEITGLQKEVEWESFIERRLEKVLKGFNGSSEKLIKWLDGHLQLSKGFKLMAGREENVLPMPLKGLDRKFKVTLDGKKTWVGYRRVGYSPKSLVYLFKKGHKQFDPLVRENKTKDTQKPSPATAPKLK